MRSVALALVLLSGCIDGDGTNEESSEMFQAAAHEPIRMREVHDLTQGMDETWDFEAHEGAQVTARLYSVGNDAPPGSQLCFEAETPVRSVQQCSQGNVALQVGPALVLGSTYYDETSGEGTYHFRAASIGAGEFHVEIDVTYP